MKIVLVLLLVLVLGCSAELPPEGQIVLAFATDAPLPGGPTTPLFDRLRVEIFPPGQSTPCVGCTRELAVDHPTFDAGLASVGIAPPPGQSGWRVRVRLWRSAGTASGEPRPASTIERVVLLPVTEEEGIVEAHVLLPTEEVARPTGSLAAPIAAELGPPPTGLAGRWLGAAVVDCPAPPAPGEACVPGGAFWMGDPRLDLSAATDIDGALERLVVLSPFYLDATEVTVASFRVSGLATIPIPGGPSDDPQEANTGIPDCTYTGDAGPFDAVAVNCLTWFKADQYCSALGKHLPSEAQLEMAMSAAGTSRFPWGSDLPACGDAVYQRLPGADCATLGTGAAVPGSAARDRLRLGDVEVVDLAGNVEEWAADLWNRETEPCWGTGVFLDPFCDGDSPADGPARSIRGGNWAGGIVELHAAVRHRLPYQVPAVSERVGFRCAR